MPKILIICGTFPPQSDVGGLRPAMMAKYLPRFGWEPYVLTRDYGKDHPARDDFMSLGDILPEENIVRIEVTAQDEKAYMNQRGVYGRIRDIITIEKSFPPGVFDKVWNAAKEYYSFAKFDVIWASAPDFSSLRLGRDLSCLLAIPWIADFRDITEQEDYSMKSWRDQLLGIRTKIRRSMLVKSASCLTSVSEFHCRTLEEKTGKKCELIYNGYDDALFRPFAPQKTEKFRIVYMGRILDKSLQNPEQLFHALDSLSAEGCIDLGHTEIIFYATEPEILKDIVGNFNSWQCCSVRQRIDYKEVPAILSQASVLLLLSNYGRKGILTTKLFEYLAMERPVLCVRTETDSEIANIINKANAGFAGDDLHGVKRFLLNCYKQWRAQGYCRNSLNRKYVEKFTRYAQAGYLDRILRRVIEHVETTA